MNTEQLNLDTEHARLGEATQPVKQTYNAPQITAHGKLERTTLQTGSNPTTEQPIGDGNI